jgi:hypothetical protein
LLCASCARASVAAGRHTANAAAEQRTGTVARTWRTEIAAATVEDGGHAVVIERKPYARRWTRRWRKAGTKGLKSWDMQGEGTLCSTPARAGPP